MNEVVRSLRLAQGWTQDEAAQRLADEVECATGSRPAVDGNWFSRIEREAITWPTKIYRDALRRVFNVATDAQLGLYSQRTRRDREEVRPPPVPAPVARAAEAAGHTVAQEAGIGDDILIPCLTQDGRITWVSVPRRTFLVGGLGGAAAALAGAPTPRASALSGSSTEAGNPVEHFHQMRKVLMDSDNMFGPARVISTVREQIGVMQHLRGSWRGSDRQDLLEVQTQFADLCGWLHQDSGDHREAQYWLDRALEWAHMTRNAEAVIFILARKSQLAGDMNNPAEAVDVAEAAINMGRPRSRAAIVAATYAAHGHALQRDKNACERAYQHAHELLGNMEDDPHASYGLFLDAAYIDVQRARSLTTLGEHQKAAKAFQTAIRSLPRGYHRDRGVYLAREALAHAGAREAEKAASVGLQALRVGAETGSGRILSELDRLSAMLDEWHTTAPVAEFHNAMNDLRPRAVRTVRRTTGESST